MAKARQIKDMKVLRETPQFTEMVQKKVAVARLKDYSMQSVVTLEWDLNEDSIRDRMFRLTVNGEEAIIDLEELLHYTRLI